MERMEPRTVVCYGDSNTHGYNPEDGGRYPYEVRWTGVLASCLGGGWRVVEEGLSGRTTVFTDPIHEGMNGLTHLYPILMSHEPVDTLIVMLGTNDAKERFGVGPAMIAAGLERLLDKARQIPAWRTGCADIIITAPVPIGPAYDQAECGAAMGRGCSEKSAGLAAEYQKLAERGGFGYLDAASVASVHPRDYMHLTREGHAGIGRALAELIAARAR